MTGNTKRNPGFTLIEVLVSTAMISIVMVLVMQLIVIYFEAQRVTQSSLYMASTARQILSGMGEHIFEGYIDYGMYPGSHPTNMQEILPLRSVNGIQTVYWFWTDGSGQIQLYVCPDVPQDDECPVGGATDPSSSLYWHKLNPNDLVFTFGEFRVLPDDAPYMTGGPAVSNESPIVQVVFWLNPDEGDQSPLFQTAFTPRVYVR